MAYEELSVNFCQLLHPCIRHGEDENERQRCGQIIGWMGENLVKLRSCLMDCELELIGTIWSFAYEHKKLPSYGMFRDCLRTKDFAEDLLKILDDYEEMRKSLKIFWAADMGQVINDKIGEFEQAKLNHVIKVANRMNNAGIEGKRAGDPRKVGPRDTINYLLQQVDAGILINREGVIRPILVQNEAKDIGTYYDRLKNNGSFPTGVPSLPLHQSNFVGILGYTGGGKTTLSRFMCYQMAEAGYGICHVSLENDCEVERNKYVLLHAHNPKFDGEFDSISYKAFKLGQLTTSQRGALDYVAEDFAKNIEGQITLYQPQEPTWSTVRGWAELQADRRPFDILLIDYLQLLEPPTKAYEDGRAKMATMIKEVRQFGLTFQPERKIAIITPVQANEDGLKKADDQDGVWSTSAVNQHKELSRSMDLIVGVYDFMEEEAGMRKCMLSSVKDRDAIGFEPAPYQLSSAGWVHFSDSDQRPRPDVVDKELL